MSPARARTQTARPGDERTNHRPPRLPLCASCARLEFWLSVPVSKGCGKRIGSDNNENIQFLSGRLKNLSALTAVDATTSFRRAKTPTGS